MYDLDKQYPLYGFAQHKGYGVPAHMAAIHKHGPCKVHRRSFEPVKSITGWSREKAKEDEAQKARPGTKQQQKQQQEEEQQQVQEQEQEGEALELLQGSARDGTCDKVGNQARQGKGRGSRKGKLKGVAEKLGTQQRMEAAGGSAGHGGLTEGQQGGLVQKEEQQQELEIGMRGPPAAAEKQAQGLSMDGDKPEEAKTGANLAAAVSAEGAASEKATNQGGIAAKRRHV
jgi:hypothetical protein